MSFCLLEGRREEGEVFLVGMLLCYVCSVG